MFRRRFTRFAALLSTRKCPGGASREGESLYYGKDHINLGRPVFLMTTRITRSTSSGSGLWSNWSAVTARLVIKTSFSSRQ